MFVYLIIYSFMYSLADLFIALFIYSFIHSFINYSQTIAGMAQSFLLFIPTKVSQLWFPEDARAIATTVLSLCRWGGETFPQCMLYCIVVINKKKEREREKNKSKKLNQPGENQRKVLCVFSSTAVLCWEVLVVVPLLNHIMVLIL